MRRLRPKLGKMAMATTLVSGMLFAGASSAQADALGCNGNVCMYLSTPKNGTVYVQAYPKSGSFYGNFDLVGPLGLYRHGATRTWKNGAFEAKQEWTGIPAVVGKYCVSGWVNGTRIGYPCENIL
ncbi:hypothetical protein [Acrocarpospora catenulata]|uniref:hypothetical protein n=1 Tax=Acrocarpospora catenulata TaxID=2836182 RepID=UPI001BD9243E|nr:hypothetical protein [Acrocarpospora catenulata]